MKHTSQKTNPGNFSRPNNNYHLLVLDIVLRIFTEFISLLSKLQDTASNPLIPLVNDRAVTQTYFHDSKMHKFMFFLVYRGSHGCRISKASY